MGGLDAIPQAQKSPEELDKYIVVEIGCGVRPSIINRLESEIKKFHENPNHWYFGVDVNEGDVADAKEGLEFWKEENSSEGAERIKFIKASGTNLPFKSATVSEVVFENVMGDPRIHVEDRKQMLQEALRILKEGGEMRMLEDTTPAVSQRQGLLKHAEELFGKPVAVDGGEMPAYGIQSMLGQAFIARYHKVKKENN